MQLHEKNAVDVLKESIVNAHNSIRLKLDPEYVAEFHDVFGSTENTLFRMDFVANAN